jgi:TRAP-type C4-dicarboxylate transport system permease small subunit
MKYLDQARRVAHRDPDGRGHPHHLCRGAAPLSVRPADSRLQDYLIQINTSWAQELCIYMFVWMAKFGAAYGVRTGIHVGVDVLVLQLPPKWRKGTILFGCCAARCSPASSAPWARVFVMGLSQTDQTSPDLELPSWIVYLCIPLGSYLMCFRFLQVAYSYFRSTDLPHHDHSHVEGIDVDTAVGPTPEAPMTTLFIFALLIALMLTGMPISIALGLTVLTFLFFHDQVPIEAVALKLFTGIENFEIMAIPFFILAGNFLTHGGVAGA